MRSVVHRLRNLERTAVAVEQAALLVIVQSYLDPDDPAVAADIDALKAAGHLRGGVRVLDVRDRGQIKGLTESRAAVPGRAQEKGSSSSWPSAEGLDHQPRP